MKPCFIMRATPSGREWDGMKMIFWTCLRRYLDWRSRFASRFINFFCYQMITRISSSKWIRKKVRLQIQIATDDNDDFAKSRPRVWKNPDLRTQRLLSAKITIAMWIYSWSSRYCRNWTESLFETSKRIEEAKWSWATCRTSWWEIVSEIS